MLDGIRKQFIDNQRERDRGVVRQLYCISFTIDVQFLREGQLRGFANGVEKITRVEPRGIGRRVKHALGCRHGGDSPAGLLQHLSRLGASGLSRRHPQQRLQHLHVVLDAMVQLAEQHPLLSLGLLGALARRHVAQVCGKQRLPALER